MSAQNGKERAGNRMTIRRPGHSHQGRDYATRLWTEKFPSIPVRIALLYQWLTDHPASAVVDAIKMASVLYDPARHSDNDLISTISRILNVPEPQRKLTGLLERTLQ
jgi:hypothetical protein